MVVALALWNEDYHTLTRSLEKHSIRILEVLLSLKFEDTIPAISDKLEVFPTIFYPTKIGVPSNAGPIEFQPLHTIFRSGIFEVVR